VGALVRCTRAEPLQRQNCAGHFSPEGRFAHRYPFRETPDTDFCSLPNSAERNFDPWETTMPIGFGKRIAVR
jgi:hypothetical protein